MKREEVMKWLIEQQGFYRSPLSNELYYNRNLPNMRYRMTKHGLKLERRLSNGSWFRALSGRYKNLKLDKKGLSGLTGKGM